MEFLGQVFRLPNGTIVQGRDETRKPMRSRVASSPCSRRYSKSSKVARAQIVVTEIPHEINKAKFGQE